MSQVIEPPQLPSLITAPVKPLPNGACDTHAHIFGPFSDFPLDPERTRTPPEATPEAHRAFQNILGVQRSVVVQGSAHGTDNRAIAAAVAKAPDITRAVGVVDHTVDEAALADLVAQGFVGMRFTEFVLPNGKRKPASGFKTLASIAPALKATNLHAQIFSEIDVLIPEIDALLSNRVPIVVDHMGKAFPTPIDLTKPNVQRFLSLVREGRLWVKMILTRGSAAFPEYEDLRPLHDALVEANPKRLLWGSDWPLLSLGDKTPDPGRLVDIFDNWTYGDADLRQSVFVSNPAELYSFPSDIGH